MLFARGPFLGNQVTLLRRPYPVYSLGRTSLGQ